MRALRRLVSPTLGVNHGEPVLAWLLRDMPWLHGPGHTWRTALGVFGLSFLLGALTGALLARSEAIAWIILPLIGSRFVLDGLTMTRSWGRIGLEYRTGRWDLLRLTAQTEGAILRAYYAASCAGVWREMLVFLGLQTGMLLTTTLADVATFTGYPASALWVILVSLGAVAILGFDLLLRPRAVAALGLALAASAPRAGLAAVLGGVALIGFWFAQFVALLAGFFVASFLAVLPSSEVGAVFVSTLLAIATLTPPLLVTLFVQRTALFRLAVAVAARDASA